MLLIQCSQIHMVLAGSRILLQYKLRFLQRTTGRQILKRFSLIVMKNILSDLFMHYVWHISKAPYECSGQRKFEVLKMVFIGLCFVLYNTYFLNTFLWKPASNIILWRPMCGGPVCPTLNSASFTEHPFIYYKIVASTSQIGQQEPF